MGGRVEGGNLGKIFFGHLMCNIWAFFVQNHVKFGNFVNFSGNNHVKFEHFSNFFIHIFRQKIACPVKLTELLRL